MSSKIENVRTITREFFEDVLSCDSGYGDLLTEQNEYEQTFAPQDDTALSDAPSEIVIYPESHPGGLYIDVAFNEDRNTYTIYIGDSMTLSELEEEDVQGLARSLLSVLQSEI